MPDDKQGRQLRRRVLEMRTVPAPARRPFDRDGPTASDVVALVDSRGPARLLCRAGAIPFADRSFDFVVCRNVLQTLRDPMRACNELMRVAARGYLECPRSWAQHIASSPSDRWLVDFECETLIFRETFAEETCDVLEMQTRMNDPRFLHYWNSAAVRAVRNVELRWNDFFAVASLTREQRLHGCGTEQRKLWRRTLRRARTIESVRQELRTELIRLWRG